MSGFAATPRKDLILNLSPLHVEDARPDVLKAFIMNRGRNLRMTQKRSNA